MNNTANTSSLEGPDNIFGLFEDSNRHTTEVKSNNKISCSPVTGKIHIAKENESSHNIKEVSIILQVEFLSLRLDEPFGIMFE